MHSSVDRARFSDASAVMRRAIELASLGEGYVEPNPMVGAVLVDERLNCLGEGYHERFGGPHAEINALRAGAASLSGATMYVTLEPCCHHGKTPPCTKALIEGGLRKVIVATPDPSPRMSGAGITELRQAGIEVELGLLADEAKRLIAPFAKLATTALPYVHAKWAMTLDGKLASRAGTSRWISNPKSRKVVHRLRGRMDAILVGIGTVRLDDPLLTARPPGPRTAIRVVVDSMAALSADSQLVWTCREAPVLVITGPLAAEENVSRLSKAGVEVVSVAAPPAETGGEECRRRPDLHRVLEELGSRQMTNVLVEGGGRLLGSLFDEQLVDEVHVFIGPKIVGGSEAPTPVAGRGLPMIPDEASLRYSQIEIFEGDVYVRGQYRGSTER